MGWEITIDEINSKGKIIKSFIGNVNYCSNDNETIEISIQVEPNKERESFTFKQTNGKCLNSDKYKISLKDVNFINDPKNWIVPKGKFKDK